MTSRIRRRHAAVLALAMLAGVLGCRHDPPPVSRVPTAPSYPTATAKPRPPQPDVPSSIPPGARALSDEVGLASWYGTVYNRQRAADGSVYDQDGLTAASRTLPLGVLARVTNLATGDTAVVRITDRGPFVPGRILDLSAGAARATGLYRTGVGRVRVEAFAPEGMVDTPGKWCVQIGAFLDPDDARQLKNDLLQHFASAKIVSFTGPTGSWVRVTPLGSDREQSAAIAAEVRVPDPGVAAYLTRLN